MIVDLFKMAWVLLGALAIACGLLAGLFTLTTLWLWGPVIVIWLLLASRWFPVD